MPHTRLLHRIRAHVIGGEILALVKELLKDKEKGLMCHFQVGRLFLWGQHKKQDRSLLTIHFHDLFQETKSNVFKFPDGGLSQGKQHQGGQYK